MKKIHYRNIGYPKTGTNWLWKQFMAHPQVDGKIDFVYKEYNTSKFEDYQKVYNNYNFTVNLDTHVFAVMNDDSHFNHPKNIHEYTTHITLSFRNPYEILNSMYNMEKNRNPNFKISAQEYANINNPAVKMYCDTKTIFNNWNQCKISIQYLFYDDLEKDPRKYMTDLCQYIGIYPFYSEKIGVAFKTDKKEQLIFDDENLIKYINTGISTIEDYTKRNLSHWKK